MGHQPRVALLSALALLCLAHRVAGQATGVPPSSLRPLPSG